MTTPPTEQNTTGELEPAPAVPVAPAPKPGIPRTVLLGSVVGGLAIVAAGTFFLLPKFTGGGNDAGDSSTTAPPAPPPAAKPVGANPVAAQSPIKRPGNPSPKPSPAVNVAKQQAALAAKSGAFGNTTRPGNVDLETSFDNVPKTLGGTDAPIYGSNPTAKGGAVGAAPTAAASPGAAAAAPASSKPAPIVQGAVPSLRRPDPFVSTLTIPLLRAYAYTLAVPIRMAPQPKPPVVKTKELDPELAYGPLPFVPRRVAGYLQNGGVSAILETGNFGQGAIDIVAPGQTVSSGIPGIAPLTVESISSSELVLRAVDGRSARVTLSGIPGGPNIPSAGVGATGYPGPVGPPAGI